MISSALLTELSRCFFEQQYQQALIDLVGETSIEKERAKEELYNDLDVELQKQLKVFIVDYLGERLWELENERKI